MPLPALQRIAIPAVVVGNLFLAVASQLLFRSIDPHPLTSNQTLKFNALVVAFFICYYRICFTDPGRVPEGWTPSALDKKVEDSGKDDDSWKTRQRWCRKCNACKPPRAHHCKICERCILRMDHHCPWTANCVSHTTFPHFVRFLFYALTCACYLEYFLVIRVRLLWLNRKLPSYLGPSVSQLILLFILTVITSLLCFAMSILLARTLWCLGANTTTIEGWEIERHETLVRRARYLDGYLEGPNGTKVRIVKQEFPWDIGIYANISQGMGSRNPVSWFWPFAATPSVESGLSFEDNGLEDPGTSWPPPDPDRMFRVSRTFDPSTAFTQSLDPDDFRKRQQADQVRYSSTRDDENIRRRQPFHLRYTADGTRKPGNKANNYYDNDESAVQSESEEEVVDEFDEDGGEEAWRNSEGERLGDFGVDEDVEFYDEEDDVPLAELMRRKKEALSSGPST